ncbi:hypothetical protein [Fuchsiella alkaliacetigena]|nr:hypothetical protein [Fuchsiella alkaliacetigena]
MKRIALVIVIALLAIALVACNGPADQPDGELRGDTYTGMEVR